MAYKLLRKGDVAWNTLAIIALALIVLVVLILFSNVIREKILEGVTYFTTKVLGR